jgi:hypothetical protein
MSLGDDQWYVMKNGQLFGPIPFQELRIFYDENLITDSDFVRLSQLGAWTPVPAVFSPSSKQNVFPNLKPPPLPKRTIVTPPLPTFFSSNGMKTAPIPPPIPLTFISDQNKTDHTFRDNRKEVDRNFQNQPPQKESTPKIEKHYFVRHWRGELPLHVSWWFNGLFGLLPVPRTPS